MTEDPPSHPAAGPHVGPPVGQQAPGYPAARSRIWPAVALATVAVLLGGTALVVALIRPTGDRPAASSAISATPSYTADQTAAAHKQLCAAYKLAARAVEIDTNGDNPALAGVASVNGSLILEQALSAAPAISSSDRAAALALAAAYTKATAMGSWSQRDDPAFRAQVNEVNAKDAAMKSVCGDG
ncbi:hypothetical protein [Mycobacterium senriense]|uniref:Alanine and proline rich membrane protein n=1 Tax=Mycobacterium senriense TaxID=2775496 RepID=A0ABN6IEN4_9MYCO|nr:hypothetical protein [Mycobacterium senriense]BCZ21629.1 hypothetical protein MTY59_14840 [Mycobacterium senriense]